MEHTNNHRYEFVRISNPRGIPEDVMRRALVDLVESSNLAEFITQRGGHVEQKETHLGEPQATQPLEEN